MVASEQREHSLTLTATVISLTYKIGWNVQSLILNTQSRDVWAWCLCLTEHAMSITIWTSSTPLPFPLQPLKYIPYSLYIPRFPSCTTASLFSPSLFFSVLVLQFTDKLPKSEPVTESVQIWVIEPVTFRSAGPKGKPNSRLPSYRINKVKKLGEWMGQTQRGNQARINTKKGRKRWREKDDLNNQHGF